MRKFLHLPQNEAVWNQLKVLHCNNFKEAPGLSTIQKRMYDILSFESNSYFQVEEGSGQAGDGDGQLPAFDGYQPSQLPAFEGYQPRVRRRLRGKGNHETCDLNVADKRKRPNLLDKFTQTDQLVTDIGQTQTDELVTDSGQTVEADIPKTESTPEHVIPAVPSSWT